MSYFRDKNREADEQHSAGGKNRNRNPQIYFGEHSGQDVERDLTDEREAFRRREVEREDNRYAGEGGDSRNRYIPGVHEESDFSFGSEYVRDERAYRPSRLSQQSGSRSWVGVGESSFSGDVGGRSYSSNEYNENPSYVEDVPGHEYEAPRTRSFAGRGPQGYKRSDERIIEDLNECLTRDHDVDATGITVECKDGEIVLNGFVTDRASRRRAEEIAESCSGVQYVQNQLRIRREPAGE